MASLRQALKEEAQGTAEAVGVWASPVDKQLSG